MDTDSIDEGLPADLDRISPTVSQFFFEGNAIDGEPNYKLADTFIRTAEAFANATYQSVYIIDYYRKNFLYVSPNPLFLCGLTAEEVRQSGYQFYVDHVPEDELKMLLEINQAGFSFINRISPEERKKYIISYDFHIVNGKDKLLINHKLTGFAYLPDGAVWLALAVVSLPTHTSAGHVQMHCRDKAEYWEYDLSCHRWRLHAAPVLNETEKTVLTLSIQGLTISEIARRVCLAIDSVKSVRRRLFEKLDVNNISEAIFYATNHKLI